MPFTPMIESKHLRHSIRVPRLQPMPNAVVETQFPQPTLGRNSPIPNEKHVQTPGAPLPRASDKSPTR
jgi:hypothetical protein